ncbi:hypothetical protein DITRI_Ditri15bG0075400 [Diplodiscus trichospermus]
MDDNTLPYPKLGSEGNSSTDDCGKGPELKLKRQGDKEEERRALKKEKLERGSWSVIGSRVMIGGEESVGKGSSSREISSRRIIEVKRKKGGRSLSKLVKKENLVEVPIRVNLGNEKSREERMTQQNGKIEERGGGGWPSTATRKE